MTQKKRYIIVGSLPEQRKYVTLSRTRVDKLNNIRFQSQGWTKCYNPTSPNDFLSPQEAKELAEAHGCEIGKDCFYVPKGTIFYVPKAGFSAGIYLRHYAVDNPAMGHFNVFINSTNIDPCEFGEV